MCVLFPSSHPNLEFSKTLAKIISPSPLIQQSRKLLDALQFPKTQPHDIFGSQKSCGYQYQKAHISNLFITLEWPFKGFPKRNFQPAFQVTGDNRNLPFNKCFTEHSGAHGSGKSISFRIKVNSNPRATMYQS